MFGDKPKNIIYMGSDHAGFKAKSELREYLEAKGEYEVTDLGCFTEDPVDYPDIAREVGEKVSENAGAKGVLICGSGIGVCISANKIQGIRAALVTDDFTSEMGRKHNDANIITMGERNTGIEDMKKYLDKFLSTDFEGDVERYVRRVKKIDGEWVEGKEPGGKGNH